MSPYSGHNRARNYAGRVGIQLLDLPPEIQEKEYFKKQIQKNNYSVLQPTKNEKENVDYNMFNGQKIVLKMRS